MKMHAETQTQRVIRSLCRPAAGALLAASLAMALASCKKQEEPTPTPAPRAAQTEVTTSDSGTTTTFAPPADEPQSPPANAAQ
jgi:hypothetical protein